MWKTLTSLAIWGPGGGGGGGKGSFNNQTGPFWFTSILSFILIYRSNIEAISWYDKNLLIFKINFYFFYFFRGHDGPLHKTQGYQGHQNVIKCSPHHNGDICTTRGNNLKTSFSYKSQNVKKKNILGYLGGPEGSSMIRLCLSCFPAILSPISMYMSNKETICWEIFKFKPKIYTFFHIWGVLGGPYVEPRWTKISGQ